MSSLMPSKKTDSADREQASLELERILRALDRLPPEERQLRLRELAAGGLPKPALASGAATEETAQTRASKKELDQKRHKQFKRLCQRFWLSQHTAATLRTFAGDLLANCSPQGPNPSHSRGRLSPIEEIVWNIAPFFKHTKRTDAKRAGRVAWEDVAQFLDLVQDSPSNRFTSEARLLSAAHRRIHDRAPRTPYDARIAGLLARHTDRRLSKGPSASARSAR